MYNQTDQLESLRLHAKGYIGYKNDFYGKETEYKTLFDTWPNLIREYKKSLETYKSSVVAKSIMQKIANGNDEKETLQYVLLYFRDNFSWDKFLSISPEKTFEQLMIDKSGNQADLNLSLHEALAAKDIQASLVLFSPRQYAWVLFNYPYRKQFKSMNNFVMLKNGENTLIEDSRISYTMFYFAPIEKYNQRFLVVNNESDSPFLTTKQTLSELNVR
ncbi:hypothetical protein [Vaginella massiliensis]|uniref:hypothetical protein n=1 Tax=Vaginella massiliensis TaxID=1816680 RepID=UPI0012B67D62|nr:hypothetical protein [Vaginella massiliensis]